MSAFETLARHRIGSLNIELGVHRHLATGARHFHFDSDDGNNAFMIAFPTLPQDSTGVAHILEHTTLCGSERFPVRDPFFMMLRRSLNTFMNAFTASDSTAYPFATQNRKDFDNLLAVYLDAVFFPRLDELDFAQEGWRIELDDDGSNGGLTLHGVVYNEMKGAMSAPVAQLWQHLHAALFRDTIYRFNSGGEPSEIPRLSYQGLQDFHRRHYHPSHAVLMTYGNFPCAEHQAHFDQWALSRFGAIGEHIVAPLQPALTDLQPVATHYAVDVREGRQTHMVWGWMLGECTDVKAMLEAHLLGAVLLEHGASPLRHYLDSTPLADAPSELCGVDDSARQMVFICGVEGSDEAHAEPLQREILEVFQRVAGTGVDDETVQAIIDRLEMAQRDLGSGGYPYGLQLMGRALPAAICRRDPLPLLDLEPALERLRRDVTEPDYIANLINRALLQNRHYVRVTMMADTAKGQRDADAERAYLHALGTRLTAEARQRLRAASAALAARQEQADDADVLPCVTIADVPAQTPAARAASASAEGVDVALFDRGTNGIFYVYVVFDLPRLDTRELAMLPWFCEYLTELGHDDAGYLEVQTSRARIGSLAAHAVVRSRLHDAEDVHGWLVVVGKGLERKRDLLMDATIELLPKVRFDEVERLRELLLQSRAEAEQSITDRGHQLAMATAARRLTPGAALDDLWDGPSSVLEIKRLANAEPYPNELQSLFATFVGLRDKLIGAARRVALVGETTALTDGAARCASVGVPVGKSVEGLAVTAAAGGVNAWATNSEVNFCAKAYRAMAEADADAAVLAVLGRYLQDGFLHAEIRERGGAYGSGASYDADAATFRFFSYRDPRLLDTLNDFDRALEWVRVDRDPRRLEESILGTIRTLDQPRSPAGEAERAFYNSLYGRDDDFRQAFRDRVLNVTRDCLVRAADTYLADGRGEVGLITSSEYTEDLQQAGFMCGRL